MEVSITVNMAAYYTALPDSCNIILRWAHGETVLNFLTLASQYNFSSVVGNAFLPTVFIGKGCTNIDQ